MLQFHTDILPYVKQAIQIHNVMVKDVIMTEQNVSKMLKDVTKMSACLSKQINLLSSVHLSFFSFSFFSFLFFSFSSFFFPLAFYAVI